MILNWDSSGNLIQFQLNSSEYRANSHMHLIRTDPKSHAHLTYMAPEFYVHLTYMALDFYTNLAYIDHTCVTL